MPLDVKKAIISLILSLLSMLLADYLNSLYIEGYTFFDPLMFVANLFWAAVVVWIISIILKKKNVIPSLYAVSAVMTYFLVTDILAVGFIPPQIFSVFEIIFFLIPVYFLKKNNAKLYIKENNF
jgi:hypothetical protein